MVRFAPLPVPPGLSMSECGAAGAASGLTACPVLSTIRQSLGPVASPVCLDARLRPPTGLDECFFFISLVFRLPCGSIFCQFWLFFVFQLLLSFFWLCEGRSVSTYASILVSSFFLFLKQGCQTHFHRGPFELRGCRQRAKIILGLNKCNYFLTVKQLKLHSAL